MSAREVEIIPASRLPEWDRWLQTALGANFKQSSSYHPALRKFGYDPAVIATIRDGVPLAGASIGLRRIPFTPWTFAHASGGIPVAAGCDPEALTAFLEGMRAWSAARGAVTLEVSLRIVPDDGAASTAVSLLPRCGFEKAERLATYLIDLRHDDEEKLLASFGPNPRRHIRRARRDGLEVARTEDPVDFDTFEVAHTAMCRRKGMNPLPRGMARDVLLPAARAGVADLFVARFQGVARNFLYVGRIGTPVYNWGAVMDSAWEPNCPPTGQALHFGAMCQFRNQGYPFYDFGGSPGPVPVVDDPNYTVWRFKNEFQGRYVEFGGVWTAVLDRTGAEALRVARDAANRVRELGRRGA